MTIAAASSVHAQTSAVPPGAGTAGGSNYGVVNGCYATGAVNGTNDIGCLIGNNHGSVYDCYAAGTVRGTGVDASVGGLMGNNSGAITVNRCYATGRVTGNSVWVGGLVGWNGTTVNNCYWDADTTGQATSPGGGIARTTAQMKQQATFAGWDFSTIWQITENVTYPFWRIACASPGSLPRARSQIGC